MKTDCASFSPHSGCRALIKTQCKGCRFYKTREENELSLAKAHAHIATLPKSHQEYIAGKYYEGERVPWN